MNPQNTQNRVQSHLQERRQTRRDCQQHKLYSTLQQLSLLCRLFNKQISIKYYVEDKLIEVKASAYFVTPNTLILKNGCMVNMKDIDCVKLH